MILRCLQPRCRKTCKTERCSCWRVRLRSKANFGAGESRVQQATLLIVGQGHTRRLQQTSACNCGHV